MGSRNAVEVLQGNCCKSWYDICEDHNTLICVMFHSHTSQILLSVLHHCRVNSNLLLNHYNCIFVIQVCNVYWDTVSSAITVMVEPLLLVVLIFLALSQLLCICRWIWSFFCIVSFPQNASDYIHAKGAELC